MSEQPASSELPSIPSKRYFTIGEVSELCAVKPHVLRYWEQEFSQLKPVKRRGNRRYYQHHEVMLIRRIRSLLYEEGFTITGARNRLLQDGGIELPQSISTPAPAADNDAEKPAWDGVERRKAAPAASAGNLAEVKQQLGEIIDLLKL
jgi:DNA-binding transcriptional MerR regulator